jgi:hypothetical protein
MVYICPLTNEKIVFENHRDLDNYCYSIFKNEKDKLEFQTVHYEDYNLLKGFFDIKLKVKCIVNQLAYDRAFWMNYLKVNSLVEGIKIKLEDEDSFSSDELKELKNDYEIYSKKLKIVEPLTGEDEKENCFFKHPKLTQTL